MGMDEMRSSVLILRGISKAYPGVQALRDVDFQCAAGEIHGLVGANGSGKSTLVGIASGAITRDAGSVEIVGGHLTDGGPADARRMGLATVYQDTSLVLDLTVAQNLYLSALPELRPKYAEMVSWAREWIQECGLTVMDAEAQVGDLSVGMRQLLEVIKALVCRPKVLLLDEPTSALGPSDVEALHALMRQVAAGGTGLVYVSHRLIEVLDAADQVTVLRDGQCQGTFSAEELTSERVVELMTGKRLAVEFPSKPADRDGDGDVVLGVDGLVGSQFGPVSLKLFKGEILGIAGAEGNGQREILRALAGVEEAKGRVSLDGQLLRLNSVGDMLQAKIIMLSGDRAQDSVFAGLSVRENMGVHVLKSFSRWGLLLGNREAVAVNDLIDRLGIVTPTMEVPISSLSGGNQQKVVTARAFLYPARVLLVDEPTQGVDAKARLDIYLALRGKATEGLSVLVKSSDPHELAGLCDRVLVVSRGHIIKELRGLELTEKNIVSAFVTSEQSVSAVKAATARHILEDKGMGRMSRLGQSRWMPIVVLGVLMVFISAYVSTQSEKFLTGLNVLHLLKQSTPLAIVGIAQLCVLLIGGFDISVGSMMSVTVVFASFLMVTGASSLGLVGGVVVCLGSGLLVGLINATLVRGLRITSIMTCPQSMYHTQS